MHWMMETSQRATVICIAYNHEKWIEDALESVRLQDYPHTELIVVDNASTDTTADKIRHWVDRFSGLMSIRSVFLEEKQAYCQLFNQMLARAQGGFVVDLAGDDMLYPAHLSTSIQELTQDPKAAFVFSDAHVLDQSGQLKSFYKRDRSGNLMDFIDLKDIYVTLIRRSFICSPTVVFRGAILKKEGGYDESLFFEDFDILIRLSRKYSVCFSNHTGILKRKHAASMSAGQYLPHRSQMLPSTAKICSKIHQMNIHSIENEALKVRILYELKHALWSANFEPARELVKLGDKLAIKSFLFRFYRVWAEREWDISPIYLKLT